MNENRGSHGALDSGGPLAAQIKEGGYHSLHVPGRVEYTPPARTAHYAPDFILPNGIVIEAEGRFDTRDRQKHILIKQQLPDLDIRFVFSRATTKISKKSKATYAMWCERYRFDYANKEIPEAWLKEQLTRERANALEQWGVALTPPTRVAPARHP